MEFLLCASQRDNAEPFHFKATGIRVYSLEEALYHVYHYWKQSADDFLSAEMADWVNGALGLSHIASRLAPLSENESFVKRVTGFLSLIDYFGEGELKALETEITDWEKRLEWEKIKERADYSMERGEPEKAVPLYARALRYGENPAIYNNLCVAQMRLGQFEEAYESASKALSLAPDDAAVILNAAEAAIYCQRFDEAKEFIKRADDDANGQAVHGEAIFMRGLLACGQKKYSKSVEYIDQAIVLNGPDRFYVFAQADVYAKMRQYDKALSALELLPEKNADYHIKRAELYAASGNLSAAAKSTQKAIFLKGNDASLWVSLAMYYRMDYDLHSASGAILKALALDPGCERAKLENARIKKGMGRTREYQSILNDALRSFKRKYRESEA